MDAEDPGQRKYSNNLENGSVGEQDTRYLFTNIDSSESNKYSCVSPMMRIENAKAGCQELVRGSEGAILTCASSVRIRDIASGS